MLLALLLAVTVRGPADVESLTAAADLVVRARVVRRSSAWAPAGGQIFTTVVLRPIETWKGEPSAELSVLVPGGEVGDLAQVVQGSARFGDAEEVVVFLVRRSAGVFAVERLALGKFSVGNGRAVRDRAGVACDGCGPAEADEIPLDELHARVRARARQ